LQHTGAVDETIEFVVNQSGDETVTMGIGYREFRSLSIVEISHEQFLICVADCQGVVISGCDRTSALSIDRLFAVAEGSKLSGPHGISGTRMTSRTDSVFSTLRVIARGEHQQSVFNCVSRRAIAPVQGDTCNRGYRPAAQRWSCFAATDWLQQWDCRGASGFCDVATSRPDSV